MHDDTHGKGRDFWGPAFREAPIESAPVALLVEQADALTHRTKGLVQGEVLQDVDKGTVWVSLFARVPTLRDYQHKLVSIAHPVINSDPRYPFPLTVMDTQSGEKVIETIDEFERCLADVLSSDAVHRVIDSLLQYSQGRVAS